MPKNILLELISSIVVIVFGLIQLKLYINRNRDNSWGIFYQAAIDLRKPFDKEGWTTGKFNLYFGIFGTILGIIALISIFL